MNLKFKPVSERSLSLVSSKGKYETTFRAKIGMNVTTFQFAKLAKNCEVRETDYVHGQTSELIFVPNRGFWV